MIRILNIIKTVRNYFLRKNINISVHKYRLYCQNKEMFNTCCVQRNLREIIYNRYSFEWNDAEDNKILRIHGYR